MVITHVIRHVGTAGLSIEYPEPHLEMSDLAGTASLIFTGEAEVFTSLPPLSGVGVPPLEIAQGEQISLPIRITNRLASHPAAGIVRMSIMDYVEGVERYSGHHDVVVQAGGSQVLDLLVDTSELLNGSYLFVASVDSNGGTEEVFAEYLSVRGCSLKLPLVLHKDPLPPTPTPTPTATPRPTHTPTPTATPRPFYFDDFSDPGSGWPVADRSDVAVDYNSGNYRIQMKQDNLFVWISPQSLTCFDCIIEVDAWRSTGGNSSYGIVFGLDASEGKFYAFIIQPYLRQYSLRRRDGDRWEALVPWTDSPHINADKARNRLRAVRDSSQIRLNINDRYLVSHRDSTYVGTRNVGVYGASGPESPIWLRYDDFTVWSAASGGVFSAEEGDGSRGRVEVAPSEPVEPEG